MPRLKTNENNPATLKIVVACHLAKKTLTFEDVKDRNVKDLLPQIQIDNEEDFMFSSNSAVFYIYPPSKETEAEVNYWLEWESATLSPALANSFGSTAKDADHKQALEACLHKINIHLKNKKFMTGSVITAADISLWAVLYPLILDTKIANEFVKDNINLIQWFNFLSTQELFSEAVEQYKITPSVIAYSTLLNGAKYPCSKIQDNISFKRSTSVTSNKSLSPQHQPDTASNEELKLAEKAWNKKASTVVIKKEKPILPVPGEKNILITSALPYVNNVPHLGNIIGCVLSADVFARFCRLCNYNTLFIGGTDEYGTATETKALEEGLSCQAICDKYYKIHKEIYNWFNISFDHFGRTSSPQQTQLCQSMFLQLNENGFIFTQLVDQLHCEKCDRYLADRFVEGGCPNIGCNYEDARGDQCDGCGKLVNAVELKNPRCKICKNTPKLKTCTQFFMDLPKLEPLLIHWMKDSAVGWSHNAQVIGKAWLREGLKPRCITRDLKWGVQVPLEGYRDKVFYVWFDAPLGYMSITKNYTEQWEKWWRPDQGTNVTLYQFMAKDNVPFHCVMFPATILGSKRGYITVSHLMATEYLNYEDGKFSKSRGVGVFGNDAQDTGIPSDVFRFYLLYIRPETQDSSFSWIDFATKNNSELLNNLGNFINRALVFAKNNFKKMVPEMHLTKDDYTLLALCTRELNGYISCLSKAKLRDGIRYILSISRHGNQYMQANQPWVLLKGSDNDKLRAGTIIGVCCNIACLLALLLHPYMPDTSENLRKQLNSESFVLNPSNPEIMCLLPPGHKLNEPSPLFTKIEMSQVEELKKKFAGKQNEIQVNGQFEVKNKNKKNQGTTKNITPSYQDVANGVASKSPKVEAIEKEIALQADKVRSLKSSGTDRKIWQPEVDILLSLKKKLASALAECISEQRFSSKTDNLEVSEIEQEVAAQALKVRTLKSSGVAKNVWQPEVTVLLDLKKKLENALKKC